MKTLEKIMSYPDFCENLLNSTPKKVPFRPAQLDASYDKLEAAKDKIWGDAKEKAKAKIYEQFIDYFDKKWVVEQSNKLNFEDLERLLDNPAFDPIRVKSRMKIYHMEIIANPHPYRALMIDFRKHGFLFNQKEVQKVDWND